MFKYEKLGLVRRYMIKVVVEMELKFRFFQEFIYIFISYIVFISFLLSVYVFWFCFIKIYKVINVCNKKKFS